MTGVAAVVARELQEWKRILVAAMVAGLAIIQPFVMREEGSLNARIDFVAATAAIVFAFGVALIAGAGLIGRDLTERRMSFFFYKPLSEASVWGGKLLAAFLLAVFSAVAAVVPATLMGRGLLRLRDAQDQIQRNFYQGFGIAIFLGLTLTLVILGNSLYLTLRSRSKWVLLDFAALVIAAGLLVIAVRPLDQAQAHVLVGMLGALFGLVFVLTLLIAGYVGVRRGRIDLREVHKFHALTAWPVIGLVTMVILGYSRWVRSAGTEDLHEPLIVAVAPAGSWMAVSGKTPGRSDYRTTLLVNVNNGQTFRIAGGWIPSETIRFSGDGRRAVWFESLGLDPSKGELALLHPERLARGRLTVAALSRKPIAQETTIFGPARQTSLTLSHDGTRLALFSGELLTVTDLESERALGSVRIPRAEQDLPLYNRRPHIFFVEPNIVRVYVRSTEKILKIYEFDFLSKKLEQTGLIEAEANFPYSVSSQGMLGLRRSNALELRDARTGQFMVTLLEGDAARGWRGFLSDGRMVAATTSAGRATVAVFSPTGARGKIIDLGPAQGLRLGGEAQQGKFIVATSPNDPREWQKFRESLTPFLIDLSSGEVKKIGTNLIPLPTLLRSMNDLEPGTVGTRLFETPRGELVYLDPTTGERRVIAGHGKKGAAS